MTCHALFCLGNFTVGNVSRHFVVVGLRQHSQGSYIGLVEWCRLALPIKAGTPQPALGKERKLLGLWGRHPD